MAEESTERLAQLYSQAVDDLDTANAKVPYSDQERVANT